MARRHCFRLHFYEIDSHFRQQLIILIFSISLSRSPIDLVLERCTDRRAKYVWSTVVIHSFVYFLSFIHSFIHSSNHFEKKNATFSVIVLSSSRSRSLFSYPFLRSLFSSHPVGHKTFLLSFSFNRFQFFRFV